MMAEDPGRDDRRDDADDIDARFEEIVAGLKAEQADSARRRREAIRRAQEERRRGRPASRPLEGFDDPNPWPPQARRRGADDETDEPLPRRDAAVNPPPVEPTPEPVERREPAPAPREPEPAWRGWEGPDEEEHFIPPTPPLPAGDLHLWAIVIGLLGGPIVLILSEVFNVLTWGGWTPLGIVLSVAGVVLLFLRLPKHRDYTDSSGGAQV